MASQLWASRVASYLKVSVFRRSFRLVNPSFSSLSIPISFPSAFNPRLFDSLSYPSRILVTILKELKYADSHEWAKVEGNSAIIGITDHAQDHLGDVVYVELPEVGTEVTKGKSFGAVESVKATSDINSPVSGKITEVNEKLSESPGLINAKPYNDGWIIKVDLSNATEVDSLMDSERYTQFCDEGG